MISSTTDWEELYRKTIYSISHDLGAPFREVRCFSSLLLEKKEGLDEESATWLNHIMQSGEEAQAMLDGLLRLSRVYSQLPKLQVLGIDSVVERFGCSAGRNTSDTHICCDPDRLEQALCEIINNANQYGQYVSLALSVEGKWVSFTVVDEGPGIAEQDWPRALEPLHRVGARCTPDRVGMGLPIASAIVHQMNGELVNKANGVTIQLPAI